MCVAIVVRRITISQNHYTAQVVVHDLMKIEALVAPLRPGLPGVADEALTGHWLEAEAGGLAAGDFGLLDRCKHPHNTDYSPARWP